MSIIIGLTGGTGCGKSTAAAYLKSRGAHVIDADQIARRIVLPGTPALFEIQKAFDGVVTEDGSLDRKKLGVLVFADKTARETLNKITHKYILEEIENCVNTSQSPLVVIDAPLLLECNLDRLCNASIAVLANNEKRRERIMTRDNLSEVLAIERIGAQPDDAFYRERCRFIVENNEDAVALENKLDLVLKELNL
ncbi:MAG: dephospho-CoA kinase [Clostridia bacterium]|nr:dephospho-CoA kinase [Clostridia bacterium]